MHKRPAEGGGASGGGHGSGGAAEPLAPLLKHENDLDGDLRDGSGKTAKARCESETWDAHHTPQSATSQSCSATPSQSYTCAPASVPTGPCPPLASDDAQSPAGTTPVRIDPRVSTVAVPPQPTSLAAGASRALRHRHCMHGRGPECSVCSGTAVATSVVPPRRARQRLWSPDPDAQDVFNQPGGVGVGSGEPGGGIFIDHAAPSSSPPDPAPAPAPAPVSTPASAPAFVPAFVPASAHTLSTATASGSPNGSASAYPPHLTAAADLEANHGVLPEKNGFKRRRVGDGGTASAGGAADV